MDWYQSDHNLFTGLSQYLVSLSELLRYSTVNHAGQHVMHQVNLMFIIIIDLVIIDCGFVYCRDAVTQIAELLETIGADEHSELVIREHIH